MGRRRPILTDMPVKIKKIIAEKLPMKTSLAFRRTCKKFEEVVTMPKMHCELLSICFYRKRKIVIHRKMGDEFKTVIFRHNMKNKAWFWTESSRRKTKKKYIPDSRRQGPQLYFKTIATYLGALLKNPKLTVGYFKLRINCDKCDALNYYNCWSDRKDLWRIIKECMQSRNRRLKVKRFECFSQNPNEALMILPYLDRRSLERFAAKRIEDSLDICTSQLYYNTKDEEELVPENYWHIPFTNIFRPKQEDLIRILQHARDSPDFGSFLGRWNQAGYFFEDYQELPLELFGEGVEWREEYPKYRGRIVATDPNFVIKIKIFDDGRTQYVYYKRVQVGPPAEIP